MNGQQFWGLVALLALTAWVMRRDRAVWSQLPTRSPSQRPARRQNDASRGQTPGRSSSDEWLDDVHAWGDELDGTAQLRRTASELGRANVYATVSADVAAQQARVRGEVA